MSEEKQVLIASYLKDFVCIGSDCEDSCCQGFKKVPIDKSSYERYKAFDISGSPFPIVDNIRIVKEDDIAHYSEIVSGDDKRCPFLDQDNLCKIQSTFGAEALSYTCATFPRIFNLIGDYLQLSGTLACPEISRLALLPTEKITFELFPAKDSSFSGTCTNEIDQYKILDPNSIYSHFDNLQLQAIQILQDRNFTIEDRCALLALWAHKIQEYKEQGKINEIPMLQEEFEHFRFSDDAQKTLKKFSSSTQSQIELIAELIESGLVYEGISERFKSRFDKFTTAFQFTTANFPEIEKRFSSSYINYFLAFSIDNQHVFENFLVNMAFMNLFPLSDSDNVYKNVARFIIRFSLIRSILIGLAAANNGLDIEQDVVPLMQSYCKAFAANEVLLSLAYNNMVKREQDSIVHIVGLLRN